MSRTTKIRMRLLEDGRPQYVIAAHVGVSPARISEYALGRTQIPTKHIYKLCEVLRCNVDDLLGYEEELAL